MHFRYIDRTQSSRNSMEQRLKRLLTTPFIILAALLLWFWEWMWEPLEHFMAMIGRWPVLRLVEARIAGAPRYVALACFIIPGSRSPAFQAPRTLFHRPRRRIFGHQHLSRCQGGRDRSSGAYFCADQTPIDGNRLVCPRLCGGGAVQELRFRHLAPASRLPPDKSRAGRAAPAPDRDSRRSDCSFPAALAGGVSVVPSARTPDLFLAPGKCRSDKARRLSGKMPPWKILIVEDETKTGDYLKAGAFRSRLLRPTWCATAWMACTRGLAGDYDLLILDVNLPGLDGWQVLKALAGCGGATCRCSS